jgi:murein DD-endopeptidase MepM/ murein hydrolase activator NlpD
LRTLYKSSTLGGRATRSPRTSARLRAAGIITIIGLVVSGFLVASPDLAFAKTTYPTWADVVAARHNEARAKAEVSKIKHLLSGLNKQLKVATAAADAAGQVAEAAQQKYFAGEITESNLQAQVKSASAKADESQKEIGQYAAGLARSVDGGGTSLTLLLNSGNSSQLLNNLGAIGQVSGQQDENLKAALYQQKAAQQLKDQAAAQAKILAAQKKQADITEAAAATAAKNLQTAVDAQAAHKKILSVELAALTTKKKMTEKQYEKGVEASGGAAGIPGYVDSAGWSLPTVGVITSPWGYRYDPAAGYTWRMHYGDDIADGCLRPIYAAHSGTVSYAGPYGDIGNYIEINNGGGITTAYGHIATGYTYVRIGQPVAAGQVIARTGSTGFSTGCHLYYQVFVNGGPVNPVPFMNARGIRLG